MRDVCVIGVGMTAFGKYPQSSLADIAWPAVRSALADAGARPKDIGAAYCGTVFGGMLAGQRVLGRIGLTGIPIANVENACSSSATALHEGVLAIRSGEHDVVLVLGVEKLTKFGGGVLPLEQDDWEVRQGLSMPAVYAMRAQRYMHEFGLTRAQLAAVAVKNRRHGAANPDAQMRTPVTLDEVLAARAIAEPLTLLQCCPAGDGAAAVVLCSGSLVSRFRSDAPRVAASHLTSGKFAAGFRDMTVPEITVRCAAESYERAGVGPADLDVIELHDAFTIAELLYYEAFDLCERGKAGEYLERGATTFGGDVVVNPSGGLLAKGHPIGATGAAQVVEIVRQLRGEAGRRQVEGARIGVTHATGGGLAGFDHGACAIHVLMR